MIGSFGKCGVDACVCFDLPEAWPSLATADVLERYFPGPRAQLKRSILANAIACFNEHGLDLTTIEMVKVRCETSVGAIYHHFGNKDGLIAALFFCAMEDQAQLLEKYLGEASTAREGVAALVFSYVDWVSMQPELARFQFQARSAVAKGAHSEELADRNRKRNRKLKTWLGDSSRLTALAVSPPELLPSLIIGQAENYCRAWLAGRVRTSPAQYREVLANAAWRSVSA